MTILTEADREQVPKPGHYTTTTFEVYPGGDGQWYWRAVRANGRVVADGAEGYASKSGARRAVWRFVAQIDRENIRVVYLG